MIAKPLRTGLLLAALTVLFYWKILLTRQFTWLSQWEGVNQAYCWLQFSLRTLRNGQLPLWDPFTFSGHSFVGEMQTSGLSPFNLLLAVVPPNAHGLLPVAAYDLYVVLMHFLGLVFAYALARELKLSRMAAIVTGLCFSMGGFLARVLDWPDLLQSAIWLPLLMLFLLRALRSSVFLKQLFNAVLAGLTIGLAVLGGRIHMVMMQIIVVVTASVFFAWQGGTEPDGTAIEASTTADSIWPRLLKNSLLAGVVGLVSVGVGALQLFPSYSYASKSIRFLGEQSAPGQTKIPYAYLTNHSALPDSIVALLIPFGFNGNVGQGEFLNPYIGVLPLFLAIFAMITRWRNPWVRYFAFLAMFTTIYAFGQYSPLHGVLYALVPKLWMLRQAGRMVYLTGFALAVLAGFGADWLFRAKAEVRETNVPVRVFDRSMLGLVIACAAVLIFGSAFNLPVNPWIQLSFVLIFLGYGIYRAAAAGKVGRFAQCFAVFVIMFDLAAFDWAARNKIEVASHDELVRLVSCKNAATFLKSLPGPFRVDLPGPNPPNIGDAFGVLTNKGAAATLMADYTKMLGRPDLLDVQYIMKPASASEPDPVYHDADWKIYSTPNRFQHAWLVHRAEVVSEGARFDRVNDPNFDFRQVATTDGLEAPLDPPSGDQASETVRFTEYRLDRFKVSVTSKGRALLILSEIFDNDWTAMVNGQRVFVHPVDGGLRGVVVPDGQSSVEMEYAPKSVLAGGILTALTLSGILGFCLFVRRRDKEPREKVTTLYPDSNEAVETA